MTSDPTIQTHGLQSDGHPGSSRISNLQSEDWATASDMQRNVAVEAMPATARKPSSACTFTNVAERDGASGRFIGSQLRCLRRPTITSMNSDAVRRVTA